MTVRPVQGYLTSSGKYFDREADAKVFDAAYHFHKKLHEFLSEKGAEGMFKDFMFDNVKDFVLLHKDEVLDYMSLTNDKPRPEKADIRAAQLSHVVEPEITGPTTFRVIEPDTGPVTYDATDTPELTAFDEEDTDDVDFVQGFVEGDMGPADG